MTTISKTICDGCLREIETGDTSYLVTFQRPAYGGKADKRFDVCSIFCAITALEKWRDAPKRTPAEGG